jgi:hypothetical protein
MILTRKIFFYNMIFKDQIFAMLAWHHWVRSLQRQQFSTQTIRTWWCLFLFPAFILYNIQSGDLEIITPYEYEGYSCTVLPIVLPWWPTMPISGDAVTIVLCPLFSLK